MRSAFGEACKHTGAFASAVAETVSPHFHFLFHFHLTFIVSVQKLKLAFHLIRTNIVQMISSATQPRFSCILIGRDRQKLTTIKWIYITHCCVYHTLAITTQLFSMLKLKLNFPFRSAQNLVQSDVCKDATSVSVLSRPLASWMCQDFIFHKTRSKGSHFWTLLPVQCLFQELDDSNYHLQKVKICFDTSVGINAISKQNVSYLSSGITIYRCCTFAETASQSAKIKRK